MTHSSSVIVEEGTEIRTRTGKVVAHAGERIDLGDDQQFGWPLYVVDVQSNSVREVLE